MSMTKEDYINWAERYLHRAAVIDEKIRKKKQEVRAGCRFGNRPVGSKAEDQLASLIDMRDECRATARKLQRIADGIS